MATSKEIASNLTQARLKELLHYDPSTGVFTWRTPGHGRRVGGRAGSFLKGRYPEVTLDGVKWFLHRLAWLYSHGQFATGQVDHINGDKHCVRLSNLRDVSQSENLQNKQSAHRNNCTGVLGVTLTPYGKFRAAIGLDRKQVVLGEYLVIGDAIAARKAAELVYHPSKPQQVAA